MMETRENIIREIENSKDAYTIYQKYRVYKTIQLVENKKLFLKSKKILNMGGWKGH